MRILDEMSMAQARTSWQFAAKLANGGNADVYEAVGAEYAGAYALGTFMNATSHFRIQGLAGDEAGHDGFFVRFDGGINDRRVHCWSFHILIFQGEKRLSMGAGNGRGRDAQWEPIGSWNR
jgi:hypothetical protein